MNTEDLDLNLLRTFHAIHTERSVSRAAERLGLSQPTVSHGLRRLRQVYRDPLFVRIQGGMAPTARADRRTVPGMSFADCAHFSAPAPGVLPP